MIPITNESIHRTKTNQNIQVFVRVRPTNAREKLIKSQEVVETHGLKDIVVKTIQETRTSKKFSFDRVFGMNSQQHEVYQTVVNPLIQEVIDGYNCTVFAYGQTGTGKTHTMVGEEQSLLSSQYDDISNVGIIPRALTHLFDKLRLDKNEFAMRVSYLEMYNEELCDLLSTDDNVKIRIFDDVNKKGSVIVQGLEEVPVKCKDDVFKLLAKGQERRKTAATLMNAQSSRSHTVFSILVHIKENGPDGEEMLKIGKLNLVDLAGSENISKAGNEKGIRTRETVNINQSLLTLGRVITALVERAPHIPYRESKLTRLLQESLGGRTKTSIIATISSGHKDLEETLSTLEYAHRAKNIQNKPEINQRLTKKVILKEYTEEIDRLKRDLLAAREKNGIFMSADSYNDMVYKMENTEKELNEVIGAFSKTKDELNSKMKLFEETKSNLVTTTEQLLITEGKCKIAESELSRTKRNLRKVEINYGEAKHLLSCHQETEQKLTEQTKEIIKVADEAAEDTKSLQENIRRRKEKDENAAKASNNLLSSLTYHMEYIQQHLNEFDTQYKESRDFILNELDVLKELNSNLDNRIVGSINELRTIQKSFKDEFFEKFEKWISSKGTADSNDQNFISLMSYFEVKKKREEDFFNSLTLQVNKLMDIHNETKSQANKLCENILNKQNEEQKSKETFTSYLQTKLNDCCNDFETLKNMLAQKSLEQKSKFQEMKKMLLNLETFSMEQDEMINQKVSSIHEVVEENVLSKITNFIQSSQEEHSKATRYLQEDNSKINEKCNQLVSEINVITNAIQQDDVIRKESLKVQLENISRFEDEIKNQLDTVDSNLQGKHESLTQNIANELCNSTIKLREIKSLFQQHHNLIVEETEAKLMKSTSDATKEIEQFQNDEVYLYRSTGETPARKDYKFNRNINSTSPHDRIIKRLRLEQGLSDSIIHDSSIIEEDEVTFTPREVCNSTAINMITDTPSENLKNNGKNVIMEDENQENIPINS